MLNAIRDFISSIDSNAILNDTVDHVNISDVVQELISKSPKGHVEMLYGMTVSERLGHRPISQSWFYRKTLYGGIGKVEIGNTSEHAEFVFGGTDPHREPVTDMTPMYFWWGAPHRWPPKDNLPPGPRLFVVVNHPGQKKNTFYMSESGRFRDSIREAFISSVVKALSNE